MSASLLKELRKTSTAGLAQDYWQMNRDQTKDRLGANGLVKKGKYEPGRGPQGRGKTLDQARNTVSNWVHSTPWMHNEIGKKHSFYGRSPADEQRMRSTMSTLNHSNGFERSPNAARSPTSGSRKAELI